MITVAAIGIMDAVAISGYQDYVKRAKQAHVGVDPLRNPGRPVVSQLSIPEQAVSAAEAPARAPAIEDLLAAMAQEISHHAPKLDNDNIRLDGAKAGPGLRFTYQYTLPKVAATQTNRAAFNSQSVPQIKRSVCSSPRLKPLLNQGGISYEYRGNDGGTVGSVTVRRWDCGKS